MSDTAARGRFVWYDLMTTDPDAAAGFYDKVIGWGTNQWGGSAMPYTMWTNGEIHRIVEVQIPPEPPPLVALTAVGNPTSPGGLPTGLPSTWAPWIGERRVINI